MVAPSPSLAQAPALALVLAPDPIFKTVAAPVGEVTPEVRALMDALQGMLHQVHAIGLAAPLMGVSKRVVAMHLDEEDGHVHLVMADPEIIHRSEETQTVEEASVSFLGVSADITRPREVTVRFRDMENQVREVTLSGLAASVVQHEIEYLDGKNFLDHLSPMKRDMLMRKAAKYKRQGHAPHQHTEYCQH